jgi:hypothetical protein
VHEPVKIWYVAAQRLCNYFCSYCVSVGEWSKSREHDWRDPGDKESFVSIVRWMGTRPFEVAVRLGSLGEPLASREFLEQAGWLTRQPSVRYVELLSNGSLLTRRLPQLEPLANLGKLSLWLTFHDGQISLDKFIAGAAFAQEEYGCFVVVNYLLFPGGAETARRVRAAAAEAGLRFNLDLGYDPSAPAEAFGGAEVARAVPLLGTGGDATDQVDAVKAVAALGGDPELTRAALVGLTSPLGRPCRAGHDYLFIDIHGQVHRCSRYAVLDRPGYGNVLDPAFELNLREETWAPCEATGGCCNKEDFLNLDVAGGLRGGQVPSLGWSDA